MDSENTNTRSSSLVRSECSTFEYQIDLLKTKDFPIGKSIIFPSFTVGGFDWVLEYYPQGKSVPDHIQPYSSLYLFLKSDATNVTAEYSFQVAYQIRLVSVYGDVTHTFTCYNDFRGYTNFINIEAMHNQYGAKAKLFVACRIKVLGVHAIVKNYPGSIAKDIEKLKDKTEKFDVTFDVEGVKFSAHRLLLAARSVVFDALLFGPTAEAKMDSIELKEIKSPVFKAFLHFIYFDELPIDESTNDKALSVEVIQDLLVAADQYGLEKLTILCEEELAKKLSVNSVVTTLELADTHSREWLKRKCLEFASAPENFSQVSCTDRYFDILSSSPSLGAELQKMVAGCSSLAKRKRTG